jgi:hypothetical protein
MHQLCDEFLFHHYVVIKEEPHVFGRKRHGAISGG